MRMTTSAAHAPRREEVAVFGSTALRSGSSERRRCRWSPNKRGGPGKTDMTIRSRIALLFNVKTTAALDQVEDPREVLDYAYGEQRAQLHTIKRGLIEVAAARRQLERQADRLRNSIPRLEDQARRA